ncbi:MAG: hypothetical protein D8M59_01830 [Planctomycetes bacterium]|nr:hypothetical protein [Planctomycetota bacterium]
MRVLGTMGEGSSACATAINDRGHVAGASYIDDGNSILRAFYWYGGAPIDIGPVNLRIDVTGINNRCEVVSFTRSGTDRARLSSVGTYGMLQPLGAWLPRMEARAYDINDHGIIVGESDDEEYRTCPTLWWRSVPYNLDDTSSYGTAFAINNKSEVVGDTRNRDTGWEERAFHWSDGVLNLLPLLPAYSTSSAVDINDAGLTIGWCWNGVLGNTRPCYWANGQVFELIRYNGNEGRANAVNEDGLIVGYGMDGDYQIAVIWVDDVVYNMNKYIVNGAGYRVYSAYDINNHGVVVGGAYNEAQETWEAVVLYPM